MKDDRVFIDIRTDPLVCVSLLNRVTSIGWNIVEDTLVGNVGRFEDRIGCLIDWCKEVGQKEGVDKPLVRRLSENRRDMEITISHDPIPDVVYTQSVKVLLITMWPVCNDEFQPLDV
jgi:hypothetical protein